MTIPEMMGLTEREFRALKRKLKALGRKHEKGE